jgi:hypothetical protein
LFNVHRGDGKRFVARADEKLTAFIELEAAVSKSQRSGEMSVDWFAHHSIRARKLTSPSRTFSAHARLCDFRR